MARIVWLVVVVAIVAAGVLVPAVAHPARTGSASATAGRIPAELVSELEFACVQRSGLLRYGNLSIRVAVGASRITAAVDRAEPAQAPVPVPARGAHTFLFSGVTVLPDATAAQTAAVQRLLSACLGRERLAPPASVRPGGAAQLRLYRYHVTVYWPCLRAHGAHPGAVPSFDRYLAASEVARLVPFQRGFQSADPTALAAARACVFEPDALRDPAG